MLKPNGCAAQKDVLRFVFATLLTLGTFASLSAQEPAEPKSDSPKVEVEPAATDPAKEAAPVQAGPVQAVVAPVAIVDVAIGEVAIAGVAVGEAAMEEAEDDEFAVVDQANAAVEVFVPMPANGNMVDPTLAKALSSIAVDNALIRRLCKLDEKQLESLKQFDAKWVKDKTKKVKAANNLGGGLIRAVVGGLVGAPAQAVDPQTAMTTVVSAHRKELKTILTQEQFTEFETAIAARDKFRNRANAECVVAMLDDRLALSPTQREEIANKLAEWPRIRTLEAHFYFQNHSYIPTLPAEVSKLLNQSQKKVFDWMQQVDFQGDMFGGEDEVFIDN